MNSGKRIGVLGGGSWPTALMKIITSNLDHVYWYMRNEGAVEHLKKYSHNPNYIQSIEFDMDKIHATTNLQEVVDNSDILIIAIPSAFIDKTFKEFQPTGMSEKILIAAVKGVINEYDSIPARYFHKEFNVPYDNIGIIGGPCHAEEVAMEKLSYLTIGCPNENNAQIVADVLSTRYIRTKISKDVFGIEIAAVLKNVYAVASGICHGLSYGDNFQAVLMANASQEMARFIQNIHPIERDINDSAYLGDLLVTGYSPYSRNRTFGTMVGRGYSVKWASIEMNMIAEGYYAVKGIIEMNKKFNIDIPIAEAIYRILYEKITPVVEIRILADSLK